jgi:hypothetical protein
MHRGKREVGKRTGKKQGGKSQIRKKKLQRQVHMHVSAGTAEQTLARQAEETETKHPAHAKASTTDCVTHDRRTGAPLTAG